MYGFLHDVLDWLRENGLALAALIVTGVLLVGFVAYGIAEHNKWVAWCEGQGGHIITDTDTNVSYGYDSDGNLVTTTSSDTDHYCLNPQGGIIDIR